MEPTHNMNVHEDESIAKKLEAFLKAPNGAFFMEKSPQGDVMYAAKLPCGPDPRFGIIMTGETYRMDRVDGTAIPSPSFEMKLNSYVDNETGRRIKGESYDYLTHFFGCPPGTSLDKLKQEIKDCLTACLNEMSFDEILAMGQATSGRTIQAPEPEECQLSTVRNHCIKAFITGEPASGYQDYGYSFDAGGKRTDSALALAYLAGTDALIIQRLEEIFAEPKIVTAILSHRIENDAYASTMEKFMSDPPPELQKAKLVREAIQDKSSVWVTFANKNGETMRMNVPVNFFRSEMPKESYSAYALTGKNRKALEDFISCGSTDWHSRNVYLKDIIALEFKNKLLYRDDSFYDRAAEKSTPSLEDRLKDAGARAAASQNSPVAGKEMDR